MVAMLALHIVFVVFVADLNLKTDKEPLPAALQRNLPPLFDTASHRIADASSQPLLTFWLRSEIPLEATEDQIANGVTYREVVSGSLIGCVEVHRNWVDFRKQEIKPGVYTLRLAVQPATGDHEGTAPHQDFCVLCPADKDTNPEPREIAKLIELSSKVTGTAHPSVMLLFPVKKPAELKEAKLNSPATGIQTLVVTRDAKGEKTKTKIGFAFVIEGVRKE